MKILKILIFTFLLLPTLSLSQSTIITFDGITTDTTNLTNSQKEKYLKIIDQDFFETGYIVTLANLDEQQNNGQIAFNFPEVNCPVVFQANKVKFVNNNNYSWSGSIVLEDNGCDLIDGSAIILRKEGSYIGHFSFDEYTFTLDDLGEGKQLLSKFNFTEEIAFCGMQNSDSSSINNSSNIVEAREGSNCPIGVLILYTQKALDKCSDIDATIDLAIEKTNTAYFRSNVDFEMKLLGSEQLTFTEGNNILTDLTLFASLPNVITLRDATYKADLVILLTDGDYGSFKGRAIGFGPGVNTAFAIVEVADISKHNVFAHETGHLLGCHHEFGNDPTGGPSEHAHKFEIGLFKIRKRRTIMWSKTARIKKKEILNFSNPTVEYSGTPTGTWGSENNALTLNQNGCAVSAYRQDTNLGINGYVSTPGGVCLNEYFFANASITGGVVGTYQYNWSYSYDGFNYTSLNENQESVTIPGIALPPVTIGIFSIFVRLEITDQNGNTHNIYNSVPASNSVDIGQDYPCSIIFEFNDDTPQSSIDIYPNPAMTEISIKSKDELQSIKIFNFQGKQFTFSNKTSSSIDVSSLPKGSYVIQFKTSKGYSTKKFLKY